MPARRKRQQKQITFEYIFKQWIAPLFMITVGAVVAAFALEEFLVPFTILDGGIVGISMIISQLSGWPLGVLTIVLNIPFIVD